MVHLFRMNPKQFLIIGGVVLVLVGIAGFAGLIGPTASVSIFHDFWWFDMYENWAHLILGIVALISAFVLSPMLQKYLTIVVGIGGLFFGVFSLVFSMGGSADFYGALLQNPADTALHFIVGIWALWAGLRKQNTMMM